MRTLTITLTGPELESVLAAVDNQADALRAAGEPDDTDLDSAYAKLYAALGGN